MKSIILASHKVRLKILSDNGFKVAYANIDEETVKIFFERRTVH